MQIETATETVENDGWSYKYRREFVLYNQGEGFIQEVVTHADDHFSAESTYVPTFQSENKVRITNMLDCSLFALTINY